ncbi:MAG: HlyD family efflux transporter periplasmic adaptor subunit [Nitrospinaceae bacterium]|jgi:multidrug efflux pump subunit AcrA (membrane-fusion protein)|nr:HlyD family efflux transporter periplasmic adaptor subunit [Nitrospinaceae bacterium]MBT3433381.1 HlyD family efflux transporter periplasmic adaptor subunit [Nitrospinaceae bacterium]MBT3821028.1 HlyD family efflux transporter periplasmic adaptor subunit [Nitrospinaceae bacterium]MBT4094545.1 HlyD family efflux transporter periplasmic adaptor subunit [Nitrospinaceae bacterium]MBT4431381.1 HlyD family efflux transporter periplasmic adaptor subunit [Nitrospinaceae bacterium]
MKSRQNKILVSAAVVLILGIALTVFLVRNPREAVTVEPVKRGRLVRTLRLKKQKKTFLINAFGSVRPRNEIKVVAEVSGRVIRRSDGFRDGGFIKKGDTLFKIDPVDYKLAVAQREAEIAQLTADISKLLQEENNYRADLAIAQRYLDVVQNELKRNQRLRKQKVVSPGKLDISLQAVLRQEGEVQRINNLISLVAPNLAQKKAALDVTRARLEEARLNLIRTRIIAPFDARVRNSNLAVGDYIREGNTVGTIYDASVLEVPVSLPVEDARWAFRRIEGQQFPRTQDELQQYFSSAKITWSRFGETFEWQGRVTLVGAGLDEATRAVTMVIEVPEPFKSWKPGKHPPLTVGMFVKVGIVGITLQDVYVIPRSALRPGDQIYLYRGGVLDMLSVKVIRKGHGEVVFENGVEEGDSLILSVIPAAVQGMKLRALEEGPRQASRAGKDSP